MRSAPKLILALALTASGAALVALDQWTKALADSFLAGKGTVYLVGDFAVLVYARNRGAFLSLGSALPPALRAILLVALPLAALAFFGLAFLRRGLTGSRTAEFAAVTLVLAGGLGNLVDRLFLGEVRDFINFGIGGVRTGIMNLADLYILAAAIVMIVCMVRARGPTASADAS
jgi:signal peptidase II